MVHHMGRLAMDLTGHSYGRITVISRAPNAPRDKAQWFCLCTCGNALVARADSLRTGNTSSCGCSRGWSGTVTYSAAHQRIRKKLGKAKRHPCFDCGAIAAEWSYNHTDPDELVGPIRPGSDHHAAYSTDPAFYEPRCKSCHTKFDQRKAKDPPCKTGRVRPMGVSRA